MAEKEIFEAVEKEMDLANEQPNQEEDSAAVEELTKDKFQRLNLFFEKEKVID